MKRITKPRLVSSIVDRERHDGLDHMNGKKKDLVTEVQTQKMFHHDLNSVFRLATKFKGFGMQLIK